MLSKDQFKGLAGQLNEGGFTAHTKGREAGLPPKNRFLVGQRDVPEGAHPLPSTGEAIESYAQQHEATLDRPNRFLGGWGEGGEGRLDVPRGYPRTPRGEVAARKSTLRNTQEAYGEMGASRTYEGTTYNPFHSRFQDPFSGEHDPEEAHPSMYFAGDRRLWTQQPLGKQFTR
jgi:hypothetical protein